uniref:Uncharacterized protein n=1 Tax=Emiliania huxleyi TaxID=2903 RepID=A0A7S3VW61_EMIHU
MAPRPGPEGRGARPGQDAAAGGEGGSRGAAGVGPTEQGPPAPATALVGDWAELREPRRREPSPARQQKNARRMAEFIERKQAGLPRTPLPERAAVGDGRDVNATSVIYLVKEVLRAQARVEGVEQGRYGERLKQKVLKRVRGGGSSSSPTRTARFVFRLEDTGTGRTFEAASTTLRDAKGSAFMQCYDHWRASAAAAEEGGEEGTPFGEGGGGGGVVTPSLEALEAGWDSAARWEEGQRAALHGTIKLPREERSLESVENSASGPSL